MKMKEYAQTLTEVAQKNGRPIELALSDFLDFLTEYHDVRHFTGDLAQWKEHIVDAMEQKEDYFRLMMDWYDDVAKSMDMGHWLDLFGQIYEELYLSRGKASSQGQFFTPPTISDLMSQIVMGRREDQTEIKGGKVNDCAAGSGRLLLSHFVEVSNKDRSAGRAFYYVAQDSDPVACKMCALNMMIHGMQGEVICQNTLALNTPSVVYHINEVRYPIPSPYYSIRRSYPGEKSEK